jgi:hypothetical protein
VGTQDGYPTALIDGEHNLTVRQFDAAGNRSDLSAALALTIDTAAPTFSLAPDFHDAKTWAAFIFNEKIEFTGAGSIDVLDAGNVVRGHYTADVHTNWAIVANDSDVADTVLELELGSGIYGPLHLQVNGVTVVDLAGNAAVIGSPNFTIPFPS